MKWLFNSIIATLSGILYVVFLKLSQSTYEQSSLISWILLIPVLPLVIYTRKLTMNKWTLISGTLLGICIVNFAKALSLTKNPGVPSAMIRCEIVFMYLVSLFVFREKFNIKKFTGIVIFIIGSISTVIPYLLSSNIKWLLYVFIVIIGMIMNDIVIKFAMKTIRSTDLLTTQLLVASIFSFLWTYYHKGSIYLQRVNNEKLSKIPIFDEYPVLYIIILVISIVMFRLNIARSFALAKNPTYPRAVINSQFVFSLILSLLFVKNSSISIYEAVGSFLMLIGILGTVI